MKRKLNICLLNNVVPHVSLASTSIPLSILYLGTYLKRENHNVDILDRRTFKSDKSCIDAMKATNPDLVGISFYSNGYTITFEQVNRIRRISKSLKIVLGGPEVSVNREGVANIFKNVDYFLAGEAELTLMQLANSLAEHDEKQIQSIEGLSYRQNGEIYHNPLPEPIKDIDSFLFPNRDLIDNEIVRKHYFRPGLKKPTDVIITSRGCPFSCNFCSQYIPRYRARSPENVLEEISELYKRGVRGLQIQDDSFTINPKRSSKILEGICERGWKLSISLRGRVDKVNPQFVRLMKRAGVRSMTLGIESGSQKILDAMNKKTTVEQNFRAIQLVRNAGMACYVDFFIGYPGETRSTIKETSEFLLKAKPHGINMGVLFPLHGSTVYNEAKEKGTLVGKWGVLEDDPWVKLPWIEDIEELWDIWHSIQKLFWNNRRIVLGIVKRHLFMFDFNDYWNLLKRIICIKLKLGIN
ncbi:MAG: radical SAM protein [candidate division Zixibacteria bacterium]|nr:radical SAM protein [candidate division Zixibacteria bacterium]